jgi:intein-encoded DNA endonuclease-like protein
MNQYTNPEFKWKEEEIKFLKENYGKIYARVIAEKLGRSLNSIRKKAHRLGLKSNLRPKPWNKKWSKEEIEEKILEVTKKLGHPPSHKDLKELNLSSISVLTSRYCKKSFNQVKKDLGLNVNLWKKRYKLLPSAKKFSPELGYIIGVLLGDGYLHYNGSSGIIGLGTKDKDFADFFAKQLEKWSGKKPKRYEEMGRFFKSVNGKIYKSKKKYIVNLCSTSAYEFLKEKLGIIKVGNKNVPTNLNWIYSTPKEFKRMVLKGLWDSEGHIDIKDHSIGFSNTNLEIIELYENLCKDLNLPTHRQYFPNAGAEYRVLIIGIKNLLKFQKQIGITIKRKREKLKRFLSPYKKRIKIYKLLFKLKKETGYGRIRLQRLLQEKYGYNISSRTINSWLSGKHSPLGIGKR